MEGLLKAISKNVKNAYGSMLNFQNPFSIRIRILIKNASLACSQIMFILQDFTWVSPSSIKISEEDQRLHASVLSCLQPELPLQSSHRGFYGDPSGLGVYHNHSQLPARPTLLREQRPQLQAGPLAATSTPPGPEGHLLLPGHKWTTLTQTGPSESPSCIYCLGQELLVSCDLLN